MITGPLYDRLKFLAQVLLPALGAAYFSLAGIWGLPSADQVVGTIVIVDTFLGVVLQFSSSAYSNSDAKFDGSLDVTESPTGNKVFALTLDGDPEYDLEGKDEILFKVNKKQDVPVGVTQAGAMASTSRHRTGKRPKKV